MGFLELSESFLGVVQSGSLSAAAEQHGMSLAAISRQVSQLEAQLGTKLLVRSPRGIRLTHAGREFLTRARGLVEAAAHARAALDDSAEARGRIVLSASVSWALTRVISRLPRLSEMAPDLKVELRLEDQPVDLIAEGVDVAIRGGMLPPESTSYRARRLDVVPRLLVASPAYLRRAGAPEVPEGLSDHSCLCAGSSINSRTWRLDGPGGEVEVLVDGPLQTRTLLARRGAAEVGMGITMLPRFMCQRAIREGNLVEVLPRWRPASAQIYALYRIELRDDPRVRSLLQALDEPEP